MALSFYGSWRVILPIRTEMEINMEEDHKFKSDFNCCVFWVTVLK